MGLLVVAGGNAEKIGDSIIAGGGDVLDFQILTAYPIFALIAINIAFRRMSNTARCSHLPHLQKTGDRGYGARVFLRILGSVDVFVGWFGANGAAVYFLIAMRNKIGVDAAHPYVLPIYGIETAVAVLAFLLLVAAGVALCYLSRRAVWVSRALLGLVVGCLVIALLSRVTFEVWGGTAKLFADSFENSIGSLFLIFLAFYGTLSLIGVTLAFRRIKEPGGLAQSETLR